MTSLEQRVARVEAVQEIQNLMGRYSYWHTANMHRECLDLFALKTPGVRAEMMWGVYEGADSLERLYPGFHAWVDGDAKGVMHMHTLTTPVIEHYRELGRFAEVDGDRPIPEVAAGIVDAVERLRTH